LRAHGSHPKYVHHEVGGNFRIDSLQAAILSAKLPHLDRWNQQRRKNAARYHTLLAGTPLTLPGDVDGHAWHHFVVRAPKRDALQQFLAEREIQSEVYYPRPLHLQPCFAYLADREGSHPVSEQASREVLALPIHPELDDAQIEFVATQVKAFYR
jgi:dTDP-4-amino-4,6-dideoxygalactose transaminase